MAEVRIPQSDVESTPEQDKEELLQRFRKITAGSAGELSIAKLVRMISSTRLRGSEPDMYTYDELVAQFNNKISALVDLQPIFEKYGLNAEFMGFVKHFGHFKTFIEDANPQAYQEQNKHHDIVGWFQGMDIDFEEIVDQIK